MSTKKSSKAKAAKASDVPAEAPVQDAGPETKKPSTAKTKAPKCKKLSAIDAAVQILEESAQSMTTKEMIDAMAAKGLWTSPNGQTPHATLYSAILREINKKQKDARFVKAERGKFVAARKP